jgi:glycosyltransferase involved in cell wall biosynthesis
VTPRSLLAVTSEIPWPLDSGGHLRSYHLLRSLTSSFDVRLVVPSTTFNPSAAAALADAGIRVRIVQVPRRTFATEALKVASSFVTREPYVMYARHRNGAVRATLSAEVARQRPDVLYLDHLDSLVYADVAPKAGVVVDMHNVYSHLAARAAAEVSGFVRRRYLARQAALIAEKERVAARAAHALLAVSKDDARHFESLGASQVVVVPNGVDCSAFERPIGTSPAGSPTILYVGSLEWPPNVSAAVSLARDVLPSIRREIPDVRLLLVGKNPAREVLALAEADGHVEIAANVPDVTPYYARAHLLAVALETGGGTRLKILEAFAAGLPVVSTPVGCEGIDAIDGEHLVIAPRASFAEAIAGVLRDRRAAAERAGRARRLALDHYDWSVVGRHAVNAITYAADTARRDAAATRALALEM